MSQADGATGLVLSGAGAYAAYSVGVVKALFRGESPATGYAPLDPRVFVGASAGGVNAALLVSHLGTDGTDAVRFLEDVWVNHLPEDSGGCGNGVYRVRGNPLQYLDFGCIAANPMRPFWELAADAIFLGREWLQRGLGFLLSSATLERRVLEQFDFTQFLATDRFAELARAIIRLDRVRSSDRILKVLATNWKTGELRVFGNKDFTDEIGHVALRAAVAIPGFFRPHEVAGVPHVDGSLVMNTPLMPAIEAGADCLHIVYFDPDIKAIPLRRLESTLDVLDRMRNINFAAKVNEDIATARWINEGLETVERASRGEELADADARAFVRVAGQLRKRVRQGNPYRKLTIHRYHPRDDLGGLIGLLNFGRDQVVRLIERGFTDAAEHDCVANQCLLPAGVDRTGVSRQTALEV